VQVDISAEAILLDVAQIETAPLQVNQPPAEAGWLLSGRAWTVRQFRPVESDRPCSLYQLSLGSGERRAADRSGVV